MTDTVMSPKVARRYIQELIGLTAELKKVSDRCAALGISKINIEVAERQIAERLEDLPILGEDVVADHYVMFFILTNEGWWPAHAGYESEACGMKGWLNYRINYKDGNCESGSVRPYRWAHCTAGDTPNYHWFDREVEDEREDDRGAGAECDRGSA